MPTEQEITNQFSSNPVTAPAAPSATQPAPTDPGVSDTFNQGVSLINQGAANALPSEESLNKASARLRARTGSAFKSDLDTIEKQFGGSANIGRTNALVSDAANKSFQAQAQGLTDLELGFQDKLQTGANILIDAGSSLGNIGTNEGNLNLKGQEISNQWEQGNFENAISLFKNQVDQILGLGALDVDAALGLGELSNEEIKNRMDAILGILDTFGQFGNIDFAGGGDQSWNNAIGEFFNSIGIPFAGVGPTTSAPADGTTVNTGGGTSDNTDTTPVNGGDSNASGSPTSGNPSSFPTSESLQQKMYNIQDATAVLNNQVNNPDPLYRIPQAAMDAELNRLKTENQRIESEFIDQNYTNNNNVLIKPQFVGKPAEASWLDAIPEEMASLRASGVNTWLDILNLVNSNATGGFSAGGTGSAAGGGEGAADGQSILEDILSGYDA